METPMLEGYYARLTTRVERGENIIPNIGNIGRIIRLEIIDFKIYFIIEFAAPFISTSGFLVAPSEWDDKRAEEFKREMGLLGYIILPEGESTFNCALLTNENIETLDTQSALSNFIVLHKNTPYVMVIEDKSAPLEILDSYGIFLFVRQL